MNTFAENLSDFLGSKSTLQDKLKEIVQAKRNMIVVKNLNLYKEIMNAGKRKIKGK